ncbi:DUF3052 family protein [Protofrankia symbiont of Coriaria ruscifolia]|uniref:DUF3052 family protein n=1 Tax=Protofrankia symbiont of Coriaria ruscifolia TaxID=1306542 RepID=UPI001F5E67D1|nr:DUF3052 family protein [Protofrankia symbiont of Coriaria ruscifolia]
MGGSIEDVAALAGVSTATVSRALRGLPGVAESTRRRVREAAAQLEYVASPQASRLASGRTGTIGVVVPDVTSWVFAQVVSGAEAVLRAAGLDLLLYNLGDDAGRVRFFDALPLRKRVDAVLILCPPLTLTEIEFLQALNIPVVLVGATVPGFASVRVDDVAGARAAVQHLINLGHGRIGLISGGAVGDESGDREPVPFTAPTDRPRGYRQALAAAGIECDPGLETAGHFTVQGGAQAMAELLSIQSPPTAVFAASDEMAMGALRTLRHAGLRVPEDMSVIGFDGHDMAELFDLTTIVQPAARQGKIAAELLLNLLDRERRSSTDPSNNATGESVGGARVTGDGSAAFAAETHPPTGGPGSLTDTVPAASPDQDAFSPDQGAPMPIVVPTSIQIRDTTCPPHERNNATRVSPTAANAACLGITPDVRVQSLNIPEDDDIAHDLLDAVTSASGTERVPEGSGEVVDVVLLWWRDDDGDLVEALIDARRQLSEAGVIWLLTPKAGREGHVEPSDVLEAAPAAGLAQTSTMSVAAEWVGIRLAAPKVPAGPTPISRPSVGCRGC